ncbi:MAG: serine/threonine protein kinase [Deltaproteobacteria bacterium]|nr:serine/threonine protein kinase [Deltaproteobacteria bacterium]
MHRVRLPHGNGEINLVIELVDPDASAGYYVGTSEDAATSLHQISPARSARQGVPRDADVRGFMLAPGGRVGKYELREQLGQGTFGLVFKARDTDLERDVAIKILDPSHQTNGDILHRFLQEARASARIAHPGIVTVLDCGKVATSTGETAYIVLELLQGESLTSRITRVGRMAPAQAVELARQIASAIDAAHRADVLHRDLKPDNIYLVADPAVPSGERIKVLDFGLAKLGTSRHTMANTVFGTPRYMSPEQCRSATQIDRRSDIYSLGCILFELVTGRTPFDGDLRQLVEQHQRAMPPRANLFSPEVPNWLDELIAQMLAKDPDVRPQTMGAVQNEITGRNGVGVAPTMMPMSANMIALGIPLEPSPVGRGRMDPGLMFVPPSSSNPPSPRRMTAPRPTASIPRRRRAPFAAAAIAFFVAAALTAVVARGRTRSASAEPAPVPPVAEQRIGSGT